MARLTVTYLSMEMREVIEGSQLRIMTVLDVVLQFSCTIFGKAYLLIIMNE